MRPPTHGFARRFRKSVEYNVWTDMRRRCKTLSAKYFRYYREQGIKVCRRWDSFVNFLADMGLRPSPKHSIDRFPNPYGNYEPGNCRWATTEQQRKNRRRYCWSRKIGPR